MSLIYQALKQSEQRVSASPTPAPRAARTPPSAGNTPSPRVRHTLGLGVMIAVGGVLAGYLLKQGIAAPRAPISPEPAPMAAHGTAKEGGPERLPVNVDLPGELPRAEAASADLPLPTAGPKLRLALALPMAVKPAPEAATKLAQDAETVATPPPPAATSPAASAAPSTSETAPIASVEVTAKAAGAVQTMRSSDDVRMLFEALNQALENHDTSLAQSKLSGIQSRLPASSVARLRAEAWFAHQTGDVENAGRVYRQLLEKIPGDEITSINLAAIERKRQRPEQAKEVLAKALRQNPGSKSLRSAVEQLAQSEVRQ
jgi:hypothetical protein